MRIFRLIFSSQFQAEQKLLELNGSSIHAIDVELILKISVAGGWTVRLRTFLPRFPGFLPAGAGFQVSAAGI